MEHANISLFLLGILSTVCLLLFIMIRLVKKENKLLSSQLTETTVTLEMTRKQLGEVQEKYAKINEFQNSLQQAELTTKFQKPRLDAQHLTAKKSAPGKYGNIQALTRKGLSIEEIASVLAISTHEAHQLVNLSKLAQENFA